MKIGFAAPSFYEAPHYSIFAGIPILEQAQDWFEGLWNWVSKSAMGAVETLLGWIKDVLGRWNSETGKLEGGLFGWIWDALAGVGASIGQWVQGAWTAISGSFDWLSKAVWGWFDGALSWLTDSFSWIGGRISEGVGWVADEIKKSLEGLATGLSQSIGEALSGIGQAISDAFAPIGKSISDALGGIWTGFLSGLQGAWNWLVTEIPKALGAVSSWISANIIDPILNGLSWIYQRISETVSGLIDSIVNLFSAHSPLKPEDALPIGIMAAISAVIAGGTLTTICGIASIDVLGTGIDLTALGHFITSVINPQMFMGAVLGVLVGVGIQTPLTQFYRRIFRPEVPGIGDATKMLWRGKLTEDQYKDVVARWGFGDPFDAAYLELTKEIPQRQDLNAFLWRGLIDENKYKTDLKAQGIRQEDVERFVDLTHVIPGSGDLIRMVVREAFDPKVVIEAPGLFKEWLSKTGFAPEWADRYWTAHFEPISLRQAYENLWRGLWDKEKFMYALLIADVHPMWREDIYNVAFSPPSARELGFGFDTGEYTVEDITKYRRWAGLSPEDAARAARALVAYRLEAERNSLRTESMADFVAGLDSEDVLRSKLAAIGTRPEVIDLWVSRAVYRADRDLTLDLVKASTDYYVKGWSTEAEFRGELTGFGIVSERLDVIVAQANARKQKAAKATVAEKKRQLTEAKLTTAFELGLISADAFTSRLIDLNFTAADAQLLYEIAVTPRPLTTEERERRVKVINTMLARTRRRYDFMILRLDAQLTLIGDEIESAEATQTEVLDVYDTETAFLTVELGAAAPEKAMGFEKRLALIRERRDVAVARHAAHMTRLKDNLAAAADRKAEIIKMRLEELAELEGQLTLVQAT